MGRTTMLNVMRIGGWSGSKRGEIVALRAIFPKKKKQKKRHLGKKTGLPTDTAFPRRIENQGRSESRSKIHSLENQFPLTAEPSSMDPIDNSVLVSIGLRLSFFALVGCAPGAPSVPSPTRSRRPSGNVCLEPDPLLFGGLRRLMSRGRFVPAASARRLQQRLLVSPNDRDRWNSPGDVAGGPMRDTPPDRSRCIRRPWNVGVAVASAASIKLGGVDDGGQPFEAGFAVFCGRAGKAFSQRREVRVRDLGGVGSRRGPGLNRGRASILRCW